jgi:putative pre-16S rRNA nuclease
MGLRPGVRLALDWGDARIGVAACDREGLLAFPLTTVRAGDTEITELATLVAEQQPIEVLIGLPRSLRGPDGPAAVKARERAALLSAAVQVPVRLIDERLTTVGAAERLRSAGKRAREQRGSIDAAAATLILEHALALERAKGSPPGELVSPGGRG